MTNNNPKKSFFKNPLRVVGIKFGFYAAMLSIASFLLFYFIDERPAQDSKLPDLIIIPLFVFFSIKEYKAVHNRNELSYKEGLSVGFATFLTMTALSGGFLFLFLTLIDPSVIANIADEAMSNLTENKERLMEKMTDEEYRNALESFGNISAIQVVMNDLIINLIIGMFGTTIFAALLRKSPAANLNGK